MVPPASFPEISASVIMATYGGNWCILVELRLVDPKVCLTASKPILQEPSQNFLLLSDVLCVVWPKLWDPLRVVSETFKFCFPASPP